MSRSSEVEVEVQSIFNRRIRLDFTDDADSYAIELSENDARLFHDILSKAISDVSGFGTQRKIIYRIEVQHAS